MAYSIWCPWDCSVQRVPRAAESIPRARVIQPKGTTTLVTKRWVKPAPLTIRLRAIATAMAAVPATRLR